MAEDKRSLLGLKSEELARWAESLGERPYRGRQLFGWLYERNVSDPDAMTDLGKRFRQYLRDAAVIDQLRLLEQSVSPGDGTTKFLFTTPTGERIESVLIPPRSAFSGLEANTEEEQRRLTLCVSTQVGCPLDCAFCATGTMGFLRNLTAGEIVDQVRQIARLTGRRITNVVFMGMGEPLLNYDNTMRAVGILSEGIGIAPRRMTVSTAGWVDGILRLSAEQLKVKLALSLHAATDEVRSMLMPVNRRFPLAQVADAIQQYYRATRRAVTVECIFFDGVNDAPAHIDRLIRFARRVPCKINVIPFHSIAFTAPVGLAAALRPSPRIEEIVARLRAAHLTVMVRSSAGEDIHGACGQLAVVQDRGRRGETPLLPAVHELPEPSKAPQ